MPANSNEGGRPTDAGWRVNVEKLAEQMPCRLRLFHLPVAFGWHCPTDAMQFGDGQELKELIEGATVMRPETGLGPRVYYRNIPGKFIAGTVYDPVRKEVIIGARRLAVSGGKIVETTTGDYGDFWFKELAQGKFGLSIDAKGFPAQDVPCHLHRQDVNLGDIPMEIHSVTQLGHITYLPVAHGNYRAHGGRRVLASHKISDFHDSAFAKVFNWSQFQPSSEIRETHAP